MANFKTAHSRVKVFEGGYANNPKDTGGETYKGVSRKANPRWAGWSIVDSYKSKSGFPKNLDSDTKLQNLVLDIYKKQYWDAIWGDKIKVQKVANDLYDMAVNAGVGRAIKLMQRTLKLSETGKMTTDLLNKINEFK